MDCELGAATLALCDFHFGLDVDNCRVWEVAEDCVSPPFDPSLLRGQVVFLSLNQPY